LWIEKKTLFIMEGEVPIPFIDLLKAKITSKNVTEILEQMRTLLEGFDGEAIYVPAELLLSRYPNEVCEDQIFFIKENGTKTRNRERTDIDINKSNGVFWPKDQLSLVVIPGFVKKNQQKIFNITEFYLFSHRNEPEYSYRWRGFVVTSLDFNIKKSLPKSQFGTKKRERKPKADRPSKKACVPRESEESSESVGQDLCYPCSPVEALSGSSSPIPDQLEDHLVSTPSAPSYILDSFKQYRDQALLNFPVPLILQNLGVPDFNEYFLSLRLVLALTLSKLTSSFRLVL